MKSGANTKKVLFISHDASRTGAPIVLLNFLKWLKANSEIPFQILLRNGGPLESEFCQVAPVVNLRRENPFFGRLPLSGSRRASLVNTINKIFFRRLQKRLERGHFGLVYANTVVCGDVLEHLSGLGCPVICHVHELEYWIRYCTGLEGFNQLKQHTNRYIAVSDAVRRNLVANHRISEDQIETIHEFIPVSSCEKQGSDGARRDIFERLGIPSDAMAVIASGTFEWRKGPDLFIQLARAVLSNQPSRPVHFLWVGGESEGPRLGELMHDVRQTHLGEFVHFIGPQPNPFPYFAACDIFAMVSREDPFPLVCLEAASLGKPILCFDGSGGAKEFVEGDCGYVIPYLDIDSMAGKVSHLLDSPELRRRLGSRAAGKVKERHNISVASRKILEVITRLM